VDCLQPDLIDSGGITAVKMIADLASAYRMPISLHNVSGLLLNMASQQGCGSRPQLSRMECSLRLRQTEGGGQQTPR